MVFDQEVEHDSQWAAIRSIAAKIGCSSETLRNWVRQAERDAGRRAGLSTEERERLKELERENRELKRANEILRKASAYFAQAELDRRPRR
jgi:transposase-like protein